MACEVLMLVGLSGGCNCNCSSHCWLNMGSWLLTLVPCPLLLTLGSRSVTSGGRSFAQECVDTEYSYSMFGSKFPLVSNLGLDRLTLDFLHRFVDSSSNRLECVVSLSVPSYSLLDQYLLVFVFLGYFYGLT